MHVEEIDKIYACMNVDLDGYRWRNDGKNTTNSKTKYSNLRKTFKKCTLSNKGCRLQFFKQIKHFLPIFFSQTYIFHLSFNFFLFLPSFLPYFLIHSSLFSLQLFLLSSLSLLFILISSFFFPFSIFILFSFLLLFLILSPSFFLFSVFTVPSFLLYSRFFLSLSFFPRSFFFSLSTSLCTLSSFFTFLFLW